MSRGWVASRFRRLGAENVVPVVSFGLVLAYYLLTPALNGHEPTDFDVYNTLQGFSSLGLVALAVGLTIIAGEFDLSVLGMQALGGVLAVKAGGTHGLLGVLAAVAACAFLGAIQGTLIARLRLQSMAVTLGGYIALLGLTNVIAGNETLTYTNTDASIWINRTVLTFFSPRSLVALAIFPLAAILFTRTRLGPELKALGGDRRSSRVVGIPVDRRLAALFAVSAGLSACAGAMLAYSNASAQLNPGVQPLVLAVSGVVLGGVSMLGGRGRIWGLFLGALAVALLEQVFAVSKLPGSTTQIVFGVLLLTVVVIDAPDLRWMLVRMRARRLSPPQSPPLAKSKR
ncbi:MAG TPA: ABC transporter permease [Solirubrobacterales bacterium]|nr:ABC transporter permease [Solirubrobacterales bacterium]